MALEREALSHKIEDDLALRNRNWDKLDAHLVESSSKHITESGTNPNGSYIKFDDGTMICYMRGIRATGDGSSTYINRSVPLPASFANNSYIVIVTPTGRYLVYDGSGQTIKYFNAIPVSLFPDTINALRFMYGDGSVLEVDYEFEVNLMAIGR